MRRECRDRNQLTLNFEWLDKMTRELAGRVLPLCERVSRGWRLTVSLSEGCPKHESQYTGLVAPRYDRQVEKCGYVGDAGAEVVVVGYTIQARALRVPTYGETRTDF